MSQILNPTEILTNLSSSKATGILQASDSRVNWNIYLEEGQIKCAANSVQHLMVTLDHHLRCLGLQNAAAAAKSIPAPTSEQQGENNNWLEGGRIIPSINWLVLREHLDREQAQQIFASLSKEAIETFLWLKEGDYKWLKNSNLPQHALAARVTFQNTDLSILLQSMHQRIKDWQNFNTAIRSPYQCPFLADAQSLTESSPPILLKIAKFLKGLSFRQLALILNQDELKIAQLLHPYVNSGEITIREPPSPFALLPHIPSQATSVAVRDSTTKLKIACIDDSPTILDEMQRFLADDVYEITKIEDPLKAAPILLRLKPDLILMDISMPNINGYKLCSFFRGSASLKDVPIIMVSGRTGFIDKTRAKMVGATDYLTKPFSQAELLAVVNRHVSATVAAF
jgi:two-component system, chemotaxis family, response regulator PixG